MSTATHILTPLEYTAYATHLKRLPIDDRYCRFRSVTSDETIDDYVAVLKKNPDEIVIGHYADDLRLDGAIQLSIIDDLTQSVRQKIAEISMSVLPDSRGQGIADALFEHAILHARTLQVEQLVTTCNATNRPMIKLVKKIGMVIDGDMDEKSAELSLEKPNIETLGLDVFRQQLGMFDLAQKTAAQVVSRMWSTIRTKI